MEVRDLLSNIQVNIKTPKGQFNNHGRYRYRSKEDIQKAVKKHLPEGAYCLVTDEIVLIGNRFYIKATATLHYKGESISAVGWARETDTRKGMDCSQITGATASYAGKYALGNLFLIDDGVDSDSIQPDNNPVQNQPNSNPDYNQSYDYNYS